MFILAADTCGEKLAWVFGITSPKYQSAIDEYYRVKRQVCFYIVLSLSLHIHYVTRYLFCKNETLALTSPLFKFIQSTKVDNFCSSPLEWSVDMQLEITN